MDRSHSPEHDAVVEIHGQNTTIRSSGAHPAIPTECQHAAHLAQRCNIIAVPLLVIFTLPVLLAAMVALRPAPPKSPWVDEAALLGVQPVDLFWGEVVFRNTCTVCHGQDANGIPMLGKPLRNSAFVQATSDDELAAYIAEGRPVTAPENTTGVPMPPRGGNATLTDERIRDAVYYLRTLQDPSAPTASLEAWIRPAQPVITQVADGAHPGAVPPSFDPAGHDAFISGCSSCHGPDAMGLPNLGKPLKTSKFIAEHTDDEMLAFVKKGRPIWDSLNTTGVDMPPKGGNPALSDDQIRLIITYLRAIHSDAEPGEAQSEIAAK